MKKYIFILLFSLASLSHADLVLNLKPGDLVLRVQSIIQGESWKNITPNDYLEPVIFSYKNYFELDISTGYPSSSWGGVVSEEELKEKQYDDRKYLDIDFIAMPWLNFTCDPSKSYIEIKGEKFPVKFISGAFLSKGWVLNEEFNFREIYSDILMGNKRYFLLIYLPLSYTDFEDAVLVIDGITLYEQSKESWKTESKGSQKTESKTIKEEKIDPLVLKFKFDDFSKVPRIDLRVE